MTEDTTQEGATQEDTTQLDEARKAIIEKALELAPFDGWTVPMLRKAASEAGLTRETQLLAFPKGVMDLLEYHSQQADKEMLERLEDYDLKALKIREKVTLAVRLRIEVVATHKDAIRRAAHTLALPMHHVTAMRITYATVDAIWRGIGDTSTDINFYSKRAILAGVYTSTMMRWLEDRSDGEQDTWAFLDRRIQNVMDFEKVKAKMRTATEGVPSPWSILGAIRYPAGKR